MRPTAALLAAWQADLVLQPAADHGSGRGQRGCAQFPGGVQGARPGPAQGLRGGAPGGADQVQVRARWAEEKDGLVGIVGQLLRAGEVGTSRQPGSCVLTAAAQAAARARSTPGSGSVRGRTSPRLAAGPSGTGRVAPARTRWAAAIHGPSLGLAVVGGGLQSWASAQG